MSLSSSSALVREIVVQFHPYITKVAARLAPEPTLVEDIVQQVIVEFLTHHDRWDLQKDPKPILAKITKHIAGKHWRKWLSVRPEAVRRVAERLRRRSETLWDKEKREDYNDELYECMEMLPLRYRQLIEQHYFEEIPLQKMAKGAGRNVNAIYQSLYQIRSILKRCIQKKASMKHRGRFDHE